jgi:hypothetical protein
MKVPGRPDKKIRGKVLARDQSQVMNGKREQGDTGGKMRRMANCQAFRFFKPFFIKIKEEPPIMVRMIK